MKRSDKERLVQLGENQLLNNRVEETVEMSAGLEQHAPRYPYTTTEERLKEAARRSSR